MSGSTTGLRARSIVAPLLHFLVLLRDLLLTLPVVLLALPLWALPWPLAARLGRFYGRSAALGWPLARRVAMINLRRAFGLERAAARRFTLEVFTHLGQSIADGLQAARRGGAALDALYRLEDPELVARVLADPRPKLFVMAHLGSWEMTAAVLARRFGERGAAIARRVDNPFLDALVKRVRLDRPEQWIEKRGATAKALARLRAGDSVALLLDENAGRRGIFVEFFGRPASTHRSAALLSLLAGAQLVAGALVRDETRGERLFLLAEIENRPEPRRPGRRTRPDAARDRDPRRVDPALSPTSGAGSTGAGVSARTAAARAIAGATCGAPSRNRRRSPAPLAPRAPTPATPSRRLRRALLESPEISER